MQLVTCHDNTLYLLQSKYSSASTAAACQPDPDLDLIRSDVKQYICFMAIHAILRCEPTFFADHSVQYSNASRPAQIVTILQDSWHSGDRLRTCMAASAAAAAERVKECLISRVRQASSCQQLRRIKLIQARWASLHCHCDARRCARRTRPWAADARHDCAKLRTVLAEVLNACRCCHGVPGDVADDRQVRIRADRLQHEAAGLALRHHVRRFWWCTCTVCTKFTMVFISGTYWVVLQIA